MRLDGGAPPSRQHADWPRWTNTRRIRHRPIRHFPGRTRQRDGCRASLVDQRSRHSQSRAGGSGGRHDRARGGLVRRRIRIQHRRAVKTPHRSQRTRDADLLGAQPPISCRCSIPTKMRADSAHVRLIRPIAQLARKNEFRFRCTELGHYGNDSQCLCQAAVGAIWGGDSGCQLRLSRMSA